MKKFAFLFLALATLTVAAQGQAPAPAADIAFDTSGGYGVVQQNPQKQYVIRSALWGWGAPAKNYLAGVTVTDSKGKTYSVYTLAGQPAWSFGGINYGGWLLWNEFWMNVPVGSQLETDIKNNPTLRLDGWLAEDTFNEYGERVLIPLTNIFVNIATP